MRGARPARRDRRRAIGSAPGTHRNMRTITGRSLTVPCSPDMLQACSVPVPAPGDESPGSRRFPAGRSRCRPVQPRPASCPDTERQQPGKGPAECPGGNGQAALPRNIQRAGGCGATFTARAGFAVRPSSEPAIESHDPFVAKIRRRHPRPLALPADFIRPHPLAPAHCRPSVAPPASGG